MTILAFVLCLLLGLAYTGLGVITAYELVRDRATRGWSPFGGAFCVMAFTCGPHHLMHAEHLMLAPQQPVSAPFVAAVALGLPAGIVFIALRLEAVLGGPGDRFVAPSAVVIALPWLVTLASGAVLIQAVDVARVQPPHPLSLAANAVLFVNYVAVGILMLRTQVARRPRLGGWSLSGVALAGVFPTCGVAHLAAGLAAPADVHSLVLDGIGVPSSIVFLWVVFQLNRHSLRDWNRRPIIGRATQAGRPSPWSAS